MGRSRLMEQQRARMMKRRARLKKKKTDIKKYGSGGKPAMTRDTSKDQSKKNLKYGSGGKPAVTRDTSKDTKPAAKKLAPKAVTPKKQMPGGSTRAQVEKSFNKAKGINNFVGPGGSRTRADLKRSESEYNKSKAKKPVRSNFASGRTGAAEYAKAMREYRKEQRAMLSKKPKPKFNRRGRRI